eukprot:scaffold127476_cov27-Tisochrysis_lutea.AAC.3
MRGGLQHGSPQSSDTSWRIHSTQIHMTLTWQSTALKDNRPLHSSPQPSDTSCTIHNPQRHRTLT